MFTHTEFDSKEADPDLLHAGKPSLRKCAAKYARDSLKSTVTRYYNRYIKVIKRASKEETLKCRLEAISNIDLAKMGSLELCTSSCFDDDDLMAFAVGCIEMAKSGWPVSEADLAEEFRAAYILKLSRERIQWKKEDLPLFGECFLRR